MEWSEIDSRLSMALMLLEAETCKQCGIPGWIGHSTDNRIMFSVEATTCYGCAELEGKRHKESKKNQSPTHGVRHYPLPRMYDDTALPDRSEEYHRRQKRST